MSHSEVVAIIEACSKAAYEGLLSFPATLLTLISAGVESYYVDYRHAVTTYYCLNDQTHAVKCTIPTGAIANEFDSASVKTAVWDSQHNGQRYPDFIVRTMRAGCIGYFVWIKGCQVHYYGRYGTTHIEYFPKN